MFGHGRLMICTKFSKMRKQCTYIFHISTFPVAWLDKSKMLHNILLYIRKLQYIAVKPVYMMYSICVWTWQGLCAIIHCSFIMATSLMIVSLRNVHLFTMHYGGSLYNWCPIDIFTACFLQEPLGSGSIVLSMINVMKLWCFRWFLSTIQKKARWIKVLRPFVPV
jgi:hypothetical protein